MNTPNPLMPQGSFASQIGSKRSMIKIVVSTILAVHAVVLGGLLFLGCKEEAPDAGGAQYADSGLSEIDPITQTPEKDPFEDFLAEPMLIPGSSTNEVPPGTGEPGESLPPFDGLESGPFGNSPGTSRPGFAAPTNTTVATTNTMVRSSPPDVTPGTPSKYVIVEGDNFWTIARDHGLQVNDVVAANPGVDPTRLQVGQLINLPDHVEPQTPEIPDETETGEAPVVHTVVSGDTLFRLAGDYGVSVKAIQDANGIRGSTIRVGQKLLIPIPE